MKTLYILTGPAGSGKSTWISNRDLKDSVVISSDKIRAELYGPENNTPNGPEIMQIFQERLKQAMSEPSVKNIYLDKTNLRRKYRKNLFDRSKNTAHVINVFFCRPLETILKQNSQRFHVVPEDIVKNMYFQTEVPRIGYDCHEIIVNGNFRNFMAEWDENYKKSHYNRFHTETIEEHINACVKNAENSDSQHREILKQVAMFHDLGKSVARFPLYETQDPLKKEVLDTLGEYYRYMHHENISAMYYLALSGSSVNTDTEKQKVLELIFLHGKYADSEKESFIAKHKITEELYTILSEFSAIDRMSSKPFVYADQAETITNQKTAH